MPELLQMSADEVLARFIEDQRDDFSQTILEIERKDSPLYNFFANLRNEVADDPSNKFHSLPIFNAGELSSLFQELHHHVMEHPVWSHPFFVRIFNGNFTQDQLVRFSQQYFNQVKNTRQCVALSIGRFSGVNDLPYGLLNERVSELTQIALAQLVADEYGVGSHDIETYPSMADIFNSTTHMVLYRHIFDGLGIEFKQQDVPMIPAVADNVLVQRLVAGDKRFSVLESLASVGLGMEWGVPEFFSLLLGGIIRFAWKSNIELTQKHLIVLIAHVQYDVLHAISVMLATTFYTHDDNAINEIKGATNMLMQARYAMMTGMYEYIFSETCAGVETLPEKYHLHDQRIKEALIEARHGVAPNTVVNGSVYRQSTDCCFV